MSKEPELDWPGPFAVKAQAILDQHGWVGERFCIMAVVDLRIFLTLNERSHRPSLSPGEDVLWLPVAAPAQEPARKRKGWEE